MELFTAMKDRRSCREYLSDPIEESVIESIIEAGTWAPSPLNMQPWEFYVVIRDDVKKKIYEEAEKCRQWALEKSGWKWLDTYKIDFLNQAPVLIIVVGDPKKSGVDVFMEEGHMGYQAACSAAIQNMHLAAYSHGLGSLWFTLFDKDAIRDILGINRDKTPLAIVCLGKKAREIPPLPRKSVKDKAIFIR